MSSNSRWVNSYTASYVNVPVPNGERGPGQSALEFQISTADGFRPITGSSIAQTQQKIIDTLHMDYDTFVNSAYLRQGHADEFTRQAPARRKEVLGNIIGLALYDQLEEQAKELSRQQETEKAQLESTLRDIGDELACKPTFETELEKAQSQLASAEAAAREKEVGLNALRQQTETLQNKKTQLDELEARISHDVKELARWDEQVRQHQSRLREYEEVTGRQQAIEAGYVRFTEARKMNEDMDKTLRQSAKLQKTQAELDRKIQAELSSLKTEHTVAQRDITRLEEKVQKLPELKNQLNQVQVPTDQVAELEATLDQKKRTGQELQAQVNHLESEKIRLQREIDELAEKLDLLSSQTQAKCPLCETELTLEGLNLIATKYNAEKQSKSDLLKSNQAELTNRQIELELWQKETSQLESRLNHEKAKAQSQVSVLMKEIAETEEAGKQLTGLRKTLDDIEQRLAKRDFAVPEQAALAAIETELTSLGYDSEKHEQVRQQLRQLEPYDHDKRKLEEAARLIQPEKEMAARAEEAVHGLRDSLESDNRNRAALSAEITLLPRLLTDLTQAEAEYRSLMAQRSQAQETVGTVKAKIQRCIELEIKKKEKEDQLARSAGEESIYRELAEAFGKKGIQNLIIETALPEIEDEANRLLGRMTDNRMHVKFETQRETKKGTVQETLDINIADELGTRNYEMFSGGEAFRINFAIRIALSKLLARRAGAPLPTLIIDEGFGTQDAAGMEKLKEAINSIQDDFNKILVITHMEEMRDAFPTRIDVVKTAEGSIISVN